MILSVAKYGTPAGKKLQDDGVTPDVLVAGNTPDQDDADSDDETATPATTPVTKPTITVDDQLTKALDLLKAKA